MLLRTYLEANTLAYSFQFSLKNNTIKMLQLMISIFTFNKILYTYKPKIKIELSMHRGGLQLVNKKLQSHAM